VLLCFLLCFFCSFVCSSFLCSKVLGAFVESKPVRNRFCEQTRFVRELCFARRFATDNRVMLNQKILLSHLFFPFFFFLLFLFISQISSSKHCIAVGFRISARFNDGRRRWLHPSRWGGDGLA
jgi:hypothetical protein